MLRLDYTNEELDLIKSRIRFTPRQIRIIDYRRDELSLVEMAFRENCDVSTINREIKKIKQKVARVWQ